MYPEARFGSRIQNRSCPGTARLRISSSNEKRFLGMNPFPGTANTRAMVVFRIVVKNPKMFPSTSRATPVPTCQPQLARMAYPFSLGQVCLAAAQLPPPPRLRSVMSTNDGREKRRRAFRSAGTRVLLTSAPDYIPVLASVAFLDSIIFVAALQRTLLESLR